MCDRLSGLTDPLLLHILSFLPTKQAVAASFLSKRWRPLGHSFPLLVIKDNHFSGREAFIQFVDYVLISGESEFLKTFVLACWTFNMPNDKINNWIDALINSKVEHLEIWIPRTFNNKLPSSILNWSTIRILKFYRVTFGTLSSVNLPSLKVLHLDRVILPDVNFLSMLLSGCALLELLVLSYLHNTNNYGPMQEIKKLNRLVAATVPPSLVPVKALSNVTFLSFEGVWSPGRRDPMWSPDADNFPTFDNLTHLECSGDWWTVIANCLRKFPKLQNLVILQLTGRAPPQPSLNVPLCLSSHLKEFTLGGFRLNEDCVAFMKFMLNNARILSTVRITRGLFLASEEEILERINAISSYHRASVDCNFLHVEHPLSSLKNWLAGSGLM